MQDWSEGDAKGGGEGGTLLEGRQKADGEGRTPLGAGNMPGDQDQRPPPGDLSWRQDGSRNGVVSVAAPDQGNAATQNETRSVASANQGVEETSDSGTGETSGSDSGIDKLSADPGPDLVVIDPGTRKTLARVLCRRSSKIQES